MDCPHCKKPLPDPENVVTGLYEWRLNKPALECVAQRITDRVTRRVVDAMVEPDADTPHIIGGGK